MDVNYLPDSFQPHFSIRWIVPWITWSTHENETLPLMGMKLFVSIWPLPLTIFMFLPGNESPFFNCTVETEMLSILLMLKDGWLNISVTYVLLGNFRLTHWIWCPKEDLGFPDPLGLGQVESLNLWLSGVRTIEVLQKVNTPLFFITFPYPSFSFSSFTSVFSLCSLSLPARFYVRAGCLNNMKVVYPTSC